MLLERINGASVDSVITASDFHDIHYIRDMLRQVFTALDASQRAFGCAPFNSVTDLRVSTLSRSARTLRARPAPRWLVLKHATPGRLPPVSTRDTRKDGRRHPTRADDGVAACILLYSLQCCI